MLNSELIKEIFSVALGTKSPTERESYLAQACRGNLELREQVESLLRAHERAGEFLGKSVPPPASSFTAERTGTIIGRYKLLELIGEGGFGSVWMAEQEEPVRRTVALKLIKAGMDTRQVLARFESERQALAIMDHPSIARVFDGGATDTGRPYFVMELVRGIPITEYCDANKLSTPERLVLFIQVCRAVQHAHQKGIIHRDLKPSNILVTEVDGAPVPKVIDFGVAKATQGRLTEHTLFTGLNQMLGTPAYMSPEQAGLGALDMDTRSDIYALGVLLYELLTGQTPLTKKDFEKAGMDEMFRLIREREPPRPSTRLRSLTREELTTIAARRQAEPVKLNRLLNGDLDWIAMKCLEKNRTRRYESASALAMDVQRHLENEPITASPPSVLYRFQKLVLRRKVAFAEGAALLVAALAGGLYWWFLPGTLNLDVTPADAQIDIDGREFHTGLIPQSIQLSAGVHQVKFHKAEFAEEERTVVVPRGGFFNIPHLTLQHEQGTLDVRSSPPGAGIGFEGDDYHAAIKERAVDTGTHELTGFAEGCFEKQRVVTIKRNERQAEYLSLESGISWTYSSPGIQNAFFILTNAMRGQPPVIADIETSKIVFLSSADGSIVGQVAMPNGNIAHFVQLDLGADIGPVLVCGLEEPGVGPMLSAYSCSSTKNPLWQWKGPPISGGRRDGISVVSVPRPGSVSAVACADCEGHVWVVNGGTGKLDQDFFMSTNPPASSPALASWNRDGTTYLLTLWSSYGINTSRTNKLQFQGNVMDLATRSNVWQKDFGNAEAYELVTLNDGGAPGVLLWGESRWRLFDSLTGDLKSGNTLPGPMRNAIFLFDASKMGGKELIFEFANPALPMLAVRPEDGTTLWQGPTNLASYGGHSEGMRQQPAGGMLVLALNNSLVEVDAATGKVRWELKAKPSNWLIDAESKDVYVTLADRRLLCVDSEGRTNWILRLRTEDEAVPTALLPAGQAGGRRDILLSHERGRIEVAHWPRLLWEATATAGLQATPLVVKCTDGKQVVLQLGAWSEEAGMVGLEGASGRILWSNSEYIPPNRAPALAPFDSDGTLAIGAIGWQNLGSDLRLIIRRAADGDLISSRLVPLTNWVTGGVAADFRGIGMTDLAVSSFGDKSIVLFDGRSGKVLWQQSTEMENMGGLVAVDLDSDGLPDLVATSSDGYVYAFRGKNGKLLWTTTSDQYPSVSPPTVADLNGDGRPEVLVTTEQGRLFVLNGADGSLIWSPEIVGKLKIAGRATVASRNGRKLVLAPMGNDGVVAFDWSRRSEVWRSPEGNPTIATPVLADLARDGSQQVVMGTTNGDVLVLNLADGKALSRFKVAQDGIEADPVVADLNNDGVSDILIASLDHRLYAIDGGSIIPGLKTNQISDSNNKRTTLGR